MLKIQQRFNAFKREHSSNGDVIIMCMTVRGQKYKRGYIRTWFKKLVSLDEYEKEELNEIIDYLEIQSFESENWQ